MLTLLWLGVASMNPLTASVVLVDGSPVDQELADLLRFIQEETSLSCELSQPGEPSLLEGASRGADELEASEPERGDFWHMAVGTTSKVFPDDKVSDPCPWVPACGSSGTC